MPGQQNVEAIVGTAIEERALAAAEVDGDSAVTEAGEGARGAVRIRGLAKRYHGAQGPALDGLNLYVKPGKAFALLGPNGAGKTTTVGIATGRIEASEGSVRLGKYDIRTQAVLAKHSMSRRQTRWIAPVPHLRTYTFTVGISESVGKNRGEERCDC
jgi:ABC-type transport system involved in cytochrome bd biosynthesis fused ATPase/permease subunit